MRISFLVPVLAVPLIGTLPTGLRAAATDGAWPSGMIEMKLMLDAPGETPDLPGGGLRDNLASWNAAAAPAIDAWNAHMKRTQITSSIEAALTSDRGNERNDVFFSSTVYGEPYDERTLAVTLTRRRGVSGIRYIEADILFNSNMTWDSYRGNRRARTDIRRVMLHEMGHVIGLDHPDEASPAQNVAAIMNSSSGNADTLQPDDIEGVSRLYATALQQPVITTDLLPLSLAEGGLGAQLVVGVDGVLAPPETDLMKYDWTFKPAGGRTESLSAIHDGFIKLGPAQLDDAGTYVVAIENPDGTAISKQASVAVRPTRASPLTRLANLSTRGIAGSGEKTLIVGFVVGGTKSRRVLLRGIGPTLRQSPFGLTRAVADTELTLSDASGTTFISNDDWDTGGSAAELQNAFAQAGAFPLIPGAGDSAVIVDLQPGVYSALITPKAGPEGIALVEAYDLDATASEANRLVNLSTRGFVGNQADEVLIAGFVVSGTGPRPYLLRGVGDTLGDFGVSDFLDDTTLELYDSAGNLIRKTDDWDSPQFLQAKLTEAFENTGAIPLTDRQESALLLTLMPGTYTLHLAGFRGQSGTALVEIYELAL